MVVLATFFSSSEGGSGSNVDYNVEIMKGTMDLLDFVGLYVVMQRLRVTGQGNLKILAVALGWGCTELICTQLLPLWVQARGLEFSWVNVQTALASNISLLQHITRAGLVWLWMRNDLRKHYLPLVGLLLVLSNYRSLQLSAVSSLAESMWLQLLLRFAYAATAGLATLLLYLTVVPGK